MFFDYLMLVLVLAGILVSLFYCLITGISPVSSTFLSRKKIIGSIPCDQKGIIYELGAGWGALAFPLARRCQGATIVTYELSPVPWLFMKIRLLLFGPRNIKIYRRNFLYEDLSAAALVVCYLYPQLMAKLSPKLLLELNPEARVISNTFEIPYWSPAAIDVTEDIMCPQIIQYQMDNAITSIHQFIDILASLFV